MINDIGNNHIRHGVQSTRHTVYSAYDNGLLVTVTSSHLRELVTVNSAHGQLVTIISSQSSRHTHTSTNAEGGQLSDAATPLNYKRYYYY